jgi:hypothetical protein
MYRLITGELRITGFDVPSNKELDAGEPVCAFLSESPKDRWLSYFQQRIEDPAWAELASARPEIRGCLIAFWPKPDNANAVAKSLSQLVKLATVATSH